MRRKTRSKEVTAQCERCLDLFDLTLVDRRGEISVEPTAAVGIRYPTIQEVRAGDSQIRLTHRPGHCDGRVRVIWPSANGPLLRDWPTNDPLAAGEAHVKTALGR